MSMFRQVIAEDGTTTYVEIPPEQVEVPEDHPLSVKLRTVTEESIARRHRIKELQTQVAQLATTEEQPAETPAKPAQEPPTQPKPVDEEALILRVVETLAAKEASVQSAANERKAAIDKILSDAGLSETYRPVIAAIPDVEVARAQALHLAQQVNRFDTAPSGGNGQRDPGAMFARVDKELGIRIGN